MKIADKTTSAVSMVKEALEKAKQYEDYHIFVSLNEENALKKAKEIDEKIARGENPGLLAGVPYALKRYSTITGMENIRPCLFL